MLGVHLVGLLGLLSWRDTPLAISVCTVMYISLGSRAFDSREMPIAYSRSCNLPVSHKGTPMTPILGAFSTMPLSYPSFPHLPVMITCQMHASALETVLFYVVSWRLGIT